MGERVAALLELGAAVQAGASHPHLHDLVERLDAIVWERDPESFRFTFVSGQVERLLGYSVESLLADPQFWFRRIHPDDRERVLERYGEIVRDGRNDPIEYRLSTAGGSTIWLRDRVRIANPRSGNPRLCGLTADVSTHKIAERRQEAEHAVTRILAESTTLDRAMPEVFKVLCKHLGWNAGVLWCIDRDEGVLRCVEVWPRSRGDADTFEAYCRTSTFAPGVGLPGIVWMRGEPDWRVGQLEERGLPAPAAAAGAFRSALAVPVLLRAEVLGVLGLYGSEDEEPTEELLTLLASVGSQIGQFIERTRAEVALWESNQRLTLLFESANELLMAERPRDFVNSRFRRLAAHLDLEVYFNYLVTPDGRELRLNAYGGISEEAARAIERLEFGQSVCGVAARDRRPFVAEEIQQSTEPLTALVRSLGITAYSCFPLLAHDRLIGTLSFGSRSRVHFDPDELSLLQAIADQVAVALDRASLMEELRRRAEELTETVRLREALLSVASHELKTPLTTLKGYAELLLRHPQHADVPTGQKERALRTIYRQTVRMHKLVDSLLDFSRLQAGHLRIERRPVDLAALVRRSVGEIRPSLREHTLELDCPAEPLIVEGDEVRLEQVVHNLFSNAIKYSPQGGPVRVRVERRDGHATLAVSDRGIGIPPEELDRIFTSFYRSPSAAAQKIGGAGLGLYVAGEIVRLHGGTIEVDSRPGEGSTFTVRLPL